MQNAVASPRSERQPISRSAAILIRIALIAPAIGLISTGFILVADPNDQIGAWLQIGSGLGLAITAIRRETWAGGLVAAVLIAAGLVVGHLSDFFGANSSNIGPEAIAMTAVMFVVASTGLVTLARQNR